MANVAEAGNEKGVWYQARSKDTASVGMHRASAGEAAPLSLYWRGRLQLVEIDKFIKSRFEGGHVRSGRLIAFMDDGRFEAQFAQPPVQKMLPSGSKFLRVECFGSSTAQPGGPALIVWGRVDLAGTLAVGSGIDLIGVYGSTALIDEVNDDLVALISDTHSPKVSTADILDCLSALAEHLRPAPDYNHA